MEAKALKNQLSGILKKGGMELHKWVELKDSYTKGCVLSTIARLFDPLGLLGPVVARAKIFMQSLWSLKIDWIDELHSEGAKERHRFLKDFNSCTCGVTRLLSWRGSRRRLTCLKPSGANRVATIQHLTNAEQWHHVSSEQNPADLVSRGLDQFCLHNNSLWWNGPTFLATKDFPERNILSSE
ncbi:uncharacterized protein TNCV_3019141 [Trichonephila clavipes]|nr:uncharacterized protein TNCV_3019141 [Trichonephila clavipes]